MADPNDVDTARLLARETYLEVLDATKHQDDKVGRLLAAVAFLIGGAIALGSLTPVLSVRYRFAGLTLTLPAFLLAVFMILVAVCVLFCLFAMGFPLVASRASLSKRPSLLFFLSIARYSEERWSDEWKVGVERIRANLQEDYVREGHNLALRAAAKYERNVRAAWFLNLALLALVLATVLTIFALARNASIVIPRGCQAAPGSARCADLLAVPWSRLPRGLAASTIAAFTGAVGFDRWRRFRGPARRGRERAAARRSRFFASLALTLPGLVFALLIPGLGSPLIWAAALAALLVALAVIFGLPATDGWRRWALVGGGLAVAAIAVVVLVDPDLALWRLVAAGSVIFLATEGPIVAKRVDGSGDTGIHAGA